MIDIGSKINGRYKVIGNIGSGGMANVFLAHDLILDRDVAVKVLRFDFQEDKSAIRRFQREALASSELVHPNIVSVYDVGEEDGMQYLVMEYVKGTDLKKYIVNNFPISYQNVVIIMRQILSAISLAHQHRIIHRDLKPQNILMDETGNVKIADFGIAIALSETSLTQTNTLLGSVHYLSPEQARGSMATRQSDIYALGIILYELLTGTVPFEGESAVSIALKHFQSEMPSVRDFNPEIPQSLENVVLHATAKEASDRYVSADEMATDLGTVLSPERINEPRFEPKSMLEETKVLVPLTDDEMPEEFKNMETLDDLEDEGEEEEIENDKNNGKKKKKNKKRNLIIGGVVLAILAVVLFLAFGPKKVAVPEVSGMTVEEARTMLEESKLNVKSEWEEIADDDVEKGKVVKTDPSVHSRVKKNEEITLYISTGPEQIVLDDFIGQTSEDVVKSLVKLGFKRRNITKKKISSDSVEAGRVVRTSPAGGEDVNPKKDSIEIYVSTGTDKIKMRDLSGYRKAEVQKYFEEVGLVLFVESQFSDSVSEGSVISQSVGAGQEIDKGTPITVTFSKGAEPAPEPAPTPTPSSSKEEPKSSEPKNSEQPTISSEPVKSSEANNQ